MRVYFLGYGSYTKRLYLHPTRESGLLARTHFKCRMAEAITKFGRPEHCLFVPKHLLDAGRQKE